MQNVDIYLTCMLVFIYICIYRIHLIFEVYRCVYVLYAHIKLSQNQEHVSLYEYVFIKIKSVLRILLYYFYPIN